MATENAATEENLDALLSWLDENRDLAGQKYEKIRRRLIQILSRRGCYEAEDVTDEAIIRVSRKLPQLAETYVGNPALYFFGVADNVYLEWLRKRKKTSELQPNQPELINEPNDDFRYRCLEECLSKLSAEHRKLIVEYYRREKSAKIENRRKMAESFGITVAALQIRAFRIRGQLKHCVDDCLAAK